MNNKGFTLIELLAVIIILGILMIIAIPSVTKYINDSRKSAYIDTAKEIISGARNLVNEGKLEMFDTDTTYYIASECIETENALKSPYGNFTKAYVLVNYNGNGYEYFWTSVDDSGQGISRITKLENLDADKIESDLVDNDIPESLGVNGRSKYIIINKEQTNCEKGIPTTVTGNVNGDDGDINTTAAQQINNTNELLNIADANRYIGNNPNNYVLFNGNELWRIIGIYGNSLKILSTVRLSENWAPNENYLWNESSLLTKLNGSYYDGLSNDSKNLIIDGVWNIGFCDSQIVANDAYSCSKTVTTIKRVGIISLYEYLYASAAECHTVLGSRIYTDGCSYKNWMIFDRTRSTWTLNKYVDGLSIIYFNNVGTVGNVNGINNVLNVYPSVYLKPDVKIIGGSGTSSDPYILE